MKLRALFAFLAMSFVAHAAHADEPWSDNDPAEPPARLAIGETDFGLSGAAEYRAQLVTINPISLNTTKNRRASFLDHRLRLDGTIDYDEKVRIVTSVDVVNGLLWGDNGSLEGGDEPTTEAGTQVNARNPNDTMACIKYTGGDPQDPSGYGYGLCDAEIFKIRRLYGDVVTPVGLLRVGRQPFTLGNNIQGSGGDGRFNRFGVAGEGSFVDRILFGTKPLEAFKSEADRNLSLDEGLFVIALYDHLVNDELRLFKDDSRQFGGAVFFKGPDVGWGKDVELYGYYVHRMNDEFDSNVNIFGGKALGRFGPVYMGIEGAANVGSTREVAAAYRAIVADPIVDQTILQFGARAVVRFDQPLWSAYLELDYASGDPDPQARTNLSQMVWAPDMNVGLLMFEHVLRFQTARAAASATEILRRLGAVSFPVDAIDTRGSFTNAVAIFPQFDFKPHEDILLRAGLLLAWAPEPVVDPVRSLLNRDGVRIDDDLINFAGGKPGKFYGAEIDLRSRFRLFNHFALDLEGAILFPGDAFEDKNGAAARSGLFQARTTFFF